MSLRGTWSGLEFRPLEKGHPQEVTTSELKTASGT